MSVSESRQTAPDRKLLSRMATRESLGRRARSYGVPVVSLAVVALLLAVLVPSFYRSQNLHVLMQQCALNACCPGQVTTTQMWDRIGIRPHLRDGSWRDEGVGRERRAPGTLRPP